MKSNDYVLFTKQEKMDLKVSKVSKATRANFWV